jgi:recombination protein RecA
MYNEGISVSGDTLDIGVEKGVIKKSGNSYVYDDKKEGEIKLGVGRENAKQFLRDNPKIIKAIKKEVWDKVEQGEIEEDK